MLLENRSPHFAGLIRRSISAEALMVIAPAFEYAMHHGGDEEIGFKREAGVSYNPRPARVGIIAISDAGLTSTQDVAATVLATAKLNSTAETEMDPDVLALARTAQNSISRADGELEYDSTTASIIALVLHLDRARQLHRMTTPKREEYWLEFLEETLRCVRLAEQVSKPLHLLLHAWVARFSAKMERLGYSVSAHNTQ